MLNRRNLPLNALRCFEVAARHSNLRQAARELGVTHGAVSRQVRILELALRTELFERSGKRLVLTARGQRLRDVVQDALDKLTDAALHLDPNSMMGSLTVATTPSLSVYWLIQVVGEFTLKYPEVELRMVNIKPRSRRLPAAFDVAICMGAPEASRYSVRELYREVLFPVASPKLLAGTRSVEHPSDLLAYPLIHDRHNQWPRWLATHGLPSSLGKRNVYVQEAFQAMIAAREGYGVAIADQTEVARELRDGTLVRLSDKVIEGLHPIVMVCRSEDRLPLRARLFTEHLLRELASRIPGTSSAGWATTHR